MLHTNQVLLIQLKMAFSLHYFLASLQSAYACYFILPWIIVIHQGSKRLWKLHSWMINGRREVWLTSCTLCYPRPLPIRHFLDPQKQLPTPLLQLQKPTALFFSQILRWFDGLDFFLWFHREFDNIHFLSVSKELEYNTSSTRNSASEIGRWFRNNL